MGNTGSTHAGFANRLGRTLRVSDAVSVHRRDLECCASRMGGTLAERQSTVGPGTRPRIVRSPQSGPWGVDCDAVEPRAAATALRLLAAGCASVTRWRLGPLEWCGGLYDSRPRVTSAVSALCLIEGSSSAAPMTATASIMCVIEAVDGASGVGAEARRGRFVVLLGIQRLELARQRANLPAVTEEAERLFAPIEGADLADLGVSEERHALALIGLGIAEVWTARIEDAERHVDDGIVLARRIEQPISSSPAWRIRRCSSTSGRSPWPPSEATRRSSWRSSMAGARSRSPGWPTRCWPARWSRPARRGRPMVRRARATLDPQPIRRPDCSSTTRTGSSSWRAATTPRR